MEGYPPHDIREDIERGSKGDVEYRIKPPSEYALEHFFRHPGSPHKQGSSDWVNMVDFDVAPGVPLRQEVAYVVIELLWTIPVARLDPEIQNTANFAWFFFACWACLCRPRPLPRRRAVQWRK